MHYCGSRTSIRHPIWRLSTFKPFCLALKKQSKAKAKQRNPRINPQASGFHSLSYFDIGNWGTRINTNYRGPNTTCGTRGPAGSGLPAPCPDPDGGNEYLRDHIWPARAWSLPRLASPRRMPALLRPAPASQPARGSAAWDGSAVRVPGRPRSADARLAPTHHPPLLFVCGL